MMRPSLRFVVRCSEIVKTVVLWVKINPEPEHRKTNIENRIRYIQPIKKLVSLHKF